MTLIFGGIEGGASNSRIILVNENGEKLGYAEGQDTNQWLVGLDEVVRRLFDLIDAALRDARLPDKTPISHLGMSLSGVDTEETKTQLLNAMRAVRKDFAGSVQICNDALGTFLTVTNEPSIVLIAGTGSICKYIRSDLTFERVGGYSYLLGDAGGAYYTAHYLLSKFLEIEDGLISWGHSIEPVRELIYRFFNIEDSLGLLPHFYQTFEKGKIAKLCLHMSRMAREGEPLCQKAFYKSGIQLGRHVRACLTRALQSAETCNCGMKGTSQHQPFCGNEMLVICCGSVFRSWDLLREGFQKPFQEDLQSFFRWQGTLNLVFLNTTAAYGAARFAAQAGAGTNIPLPANATVDLDKISVNSL